MADRDRDDLDDLDDGGGSLAAAAAALREAPVTADPLAAAAAALRDVNAATPPDIAATRVRVMASLERRGHGRRKRVIVAGVMAALGTGTLSWAAATGRIERVLDAIAKPVRLAPAPAPEVEPPVVAADHRRRSRITDEAPLVEAPAVEQAPLVEVPAVAQATTAPDSIPVPDAAAAPLVPELPAKRPPRRVAEHRKVIVDDVIDRQLYRAAHDAHFRGVDPAAALAAWDVYLVERPAGRFAIEARYNRALALIRLDRIAEARAALAPFADGTVEPAGYRQPDARALIEALDHAIASDR